MSVKKRAKMEAKQALLCSPEIWAQHTFGGASLGDPRRTKRLVGIAGQMARAPQASLPQQHEGNWGQTKGAYRFFANPHISSEQISEPVWQQTRTRAQQPGVVLLVHDDTEIDLGYESATEGVGPIGNGSHRGFLVHSVLAIAPKAPSQEAEEVLGVAFQHSWKREPAPRRPDGKKQTHAQRKKRPRESDQWWQAIEAIGAAPEHGCWVDVGDRYADMWTFFATSRRWQHQVLVRAAHNRRLAAQGPDEATEYLLDHARRLPVQGQRQLPVPSEHERRARTARLTISWGPVRIQATNGKGRLEDAPAPFEAWVVRVWEPEPPLKVGALRSRGSKQTHGARKKRKGKSQQPPSERLEPLEWILISSLPVEREEDAWRCVAWYEQRWTIEELHKGIKTGCRLEGRHLGTMQRLARLLAVVTPIALRLLQLRNLQHEHADDPAEVWVGAQECQVIALRLGIPVSHLTLQTFLRAVAQLGGFLARQGDGPPGWLTLWKGWHSLQLIVHGIQLADGL